MPERLVKAYQGLVAGLLPWPLFVHGPPGTGKTCAALALCDHVAHSRYVTAKRLTDDVARWFGVRGESFDWSTMEPGEKSKLLVLDELGVRSRASDVHYETVQEVLDRWETFPLVVISNLDAAGIAHVYDDRIASRVEAGTVVELSGPDRRTA